MENERKVFGVHRPRISYNKNTDKTHRSAAEVRRSEAGTLMRTTECGCPIGKDHCTSFGVQCEWNMIEPMIKMKERE